MMAAVTIDSTRLDNVESDGQRAARAKNSMRAAFGHRCRGTESNVGAVTPQVVVLLVESGSAVLCLWFPDSPVLPTSAPKRGLRGASRPIFEIPSNNFLQLLG